MIALTDVTTHLQQYWAECSPQEIPTQFPGVPLDAGQLTVWMEFWVTQGVEPVHRSRTGDAMWVLLDVHCFSRQANKRAIFELADQVRALLAGKTFEIPASARSAGRNGYLRLQEAVCRDLSRDSHPEPRLPLQHLVISVSGQAEAAKALTL